MTISVQECGGKPTPRPNRQSPAPGPCNGAFAPATAPRQNHPSVPGQGAPILVPWASPERSNHREEERRWTTKRPTLGVSLVANSRFAPARARSEHTPPSLAGSRTARAQNSETHIRVGLVGCGGRGTGAASNALDAGADVRLTALADVFPDKVAQSFDLLKAKHPTQVTADETTTFVGFDAFDKLLDSGVDAVLLATPAHFRPAHIEAAVERGIPRICGKAGRRRRPRGPSRARRHRAGHPKGGDHRLRPLLPLQQRQARSDRAHSRGRDWRHQEPLHHLQPQLLLGRASTPARVDGDGVPNSQLPVLLLAGWRRDQRDAGPQPRQAVLGAQAGEYPIAATSFGGRELLTKGTCFDHHAIVYEYESGLKLFAYVRNMKGCTPGIVEEVVGTQGTALIHANRIEGAAEWSYSGPNNNMYQTEMDEMFDAIRTGQPINNGDYMARSTAMAILGRVASYTGKRMTWDQVVNSQENFELNQYALGPAPDFPVAVPGSTPFA